MWDRSIFVVDEYEVVDGPNDQRYVIVSWKCKLCGEKFQVYDPPEEHKEKCLAYLVNKI